MMLDSVNVASTLGVIVTLVGLPNVPPVGESTGAGTNCEPIHSARALSHCFIRLTSSIHRPCASKKLLVVSHVPSTVFHLLKFRTAGLFDAWVGLAPTG